MSYVAATKAAILLGVVSLTVLMVVELFLFIVVNNKTLS